MKKLLIPICIIIFSACKDTPNEKKSTGGTMLKTEKQIALAGKTYFFAPEFDTQKCEAFGECDCCSSSVLFLDAHKFITAIYCESDQEFSRGTYTIQNGKVMLNYDDLTVYKEYNWEKELDTTGTVTGADYFIKTDKTAPVTVLLLPEYCKGKLYFKVDDKEPSFGTLDKEFTFEHRL